MKICDLTQIYSSRGGGVRSYLEAKRRYIREHTHTHPRLAGMGDAAVEQQLIRCQDAIARHTGVTPVWFLS